MTWHTVKRRKNTWSSSIWKEAAIIAVLAVGRMGGGGGGGAETISSTPKSMIYTIIFTSWFPSRHPGDYSIKKIDEE